MAKKIAQHVKQVAESVYRFSVINFYIKPIWTAKVILHPTQFCVHKSYYPERRQKSRIRIWLEQIGMALRFGTPNNFYFPYGFDVKTRKEKNEYLHYMSFAQMRNKGLSTKHSPTIILRDKLMFGMFTNYLGVSSPKNVAVSNKNGLLDLQTKQNIQLNEFLSIYDDRDFFCKPIDGECGDGIFHLRLSNGMITINDRRATSDELGEKLTKSRYLIQATVKQHLQMAALHPRSINTIRLVTVRDKRLGRNDEPTVFPSILRVGAGNSIVDNTSQGGLAIGIDLSSGKLKEYGFYKPEYGTKVKVHPDSSICFSSFSIPFFEECKNQACLLHSFLPGINSIGWDIAVGEEGPIFIEGNDNWEINGPQICNGGLKALFTTYLGK